MPITRKDILFLSERRKKDSFLTHFLSNFNLNEDLTIDERENELRVFKYDWKYGGAIYPILIFHFNEKDQLVKISSKSNSYIRLLGMLLLAGFVYLITESWIEGSVLSQQGDVIMCILLLVFPLLLYVGYIKFNSFNRRNILEFVGEKLNVELIKPKDYGVEWSSVKIIMRLILYPLSLSLLWFMFNVAIPEKRIDLAMGAFVIAGSYLYFDLRMIFKKKE